MIGSVGFFFFKKKKLLNWYSFIIGQHAWYHKFSSPAVNVFDVLASKDLPSGLHIVRQPRPSVKYHEHLKKLHPSSKLAAYIGDIDGTLFAMSVENYPLTQLIADSIWFDYYNKRISGDKESQENRAHCRPGSSIYPVCLIGKHNLVIGESQRPGIEGPRFENVRGISLEPGAKSIAQISFSWALFLFVAAWLLYWNNRAQKSGNKPFFEKNLLSFLIQNNDEMKENFDNKSNNKKEIGRKKKKSGKNPTVNTKKIELKDEEKGRVSPPKVQFSLQKTEEPVDDVPAVNSSPAINVVTLPEQNNNVIVNTNGEIKLNSLVVSDTILGNNIYFSYLKIN
jgi:hypothetical protein